MQTLGHLAQLQENIRNLLNAEWDLLVYLVEPDEIHVLMIEHAVSVQKVFIAVFNELKYFLYDLSVKEFFELPPDLALKNGLTEDLRRFLPWQIVLIFAESIAHHLVVKNYEPRFQKLIVVDKLKLRELRLILDGVLVDYNAFSEDFGVIPNKVLEHGGHVVPGRHLDFIHVLLDDNPLSF